MLRHRFNWKKLSAISAVTLDDRLYLRLVAGAVKGTDVIGFLRVLLRYLRGPIVLIWDNIATHRSSQVQGWLRLHPRFHEERLPAYAPELNADEGVWQYLKHTVVANYCPNTLDELENQIRHGVNRLRRKRLIINSFVKRTGLA